MWANESCKSTTYACFECRKHRSRNISKSRPEDEVTCPQCQKPMKHIGFRLQIPSKDDSEAWDQLWKQWISPGYGAKGEPEFDDENKHFEYCKAKNRDPPTGNESTGCDRCNLVWERIPENERERWRTSLRVFWRGPEITSPLTGNLMTYRGSRPATARGFGA